MHSQSQIDMCVTKTNLSMGMLLSVMWVEAFEASNSNSKFYKCGKVHPMWNGQFTFSYITPAGVEKIDYNETLALYRTEDEAEGMMFQTIECLNYPNRYSNYS